MLHLTGAMYTPETKKPFITRMQDKLAASRFLTVSVLIHAVIVLMGGSVVLFRQYIAPPDFEAEGGGLVSADNAAEAPPEQPPDMTRTEFTPVAPSIQAPSMSAISTTNQSTPNFQVAAIQPTISVKPSDAMTDALKNVAKNVGTKGLSSNIPATMGGRVGGTQRAQAMMMNGGKKESEDAVMRGLRWLVKTQNPDGSWAKGAPSFISAMTGLAVLSYLGHGETPVSAEFGPTIQKALDYIITKGTKTDGRLGGEPTFTQTGVYAHGIVTYALGEYYTMTKDERVAELLKKAVTHVVKGQSSDGSWRYAYLETNKPDTSVTGWQIQALKAAHLSGLNIEGVDAAMDKAMVFLGTMQGPKGGFGYSAKADTYSLTGVGVLCTYFWKQEKDKSVRNGIDFMMDETKKNFPVDYKGDKANLYAWYYNTQACLMVGGAAWSTWNRMFQDQIVKNQAADGSWPPMASPGVGELQKVPDGAGPFYRTNLCILMLEVYYRYMPTTKG